MRNRDHILPSSISEQVYLGSYRSSHTSELPMASVKFIPNAPPLVVEPAEVYGAEGPITLRIATGGAGQSGLIRSLAEAFINE